MGAEQVSPYLKAGIKFCEVSHYLKAGIDSGCIYIMDYIEYGITPIQAISFRDATVGCLSGKGISIFLYFGVSAQQLTVYIESGIEIWCEPFVKIFMTNGYTFTEYLREKQILSY